MSNRDDMVMRPELGTTGPRGITAQSERRLRREAARQRPALLRRAARAAAAARAASTVARGAAGRVAGGILGRAGTFGLIAAALAAGSRYLTGNTFAGMGESLNEQLLRDLDERARAKAGVRAQIGGDRDLARIVGQQGRVNDQIASIAGDLEALRFRDERGASLLRQQLPPDSTTFDMLLDAVGLIPAELRRRGVGEKLEQLRGTVAAGGAR